jgi:cytochrome P450
VRAANSQLTVHANTHETLALLCIPQINHWEYLEAVVKESLRLHYPGGDVIPLTTKLPTVIGDVTVPRGTDVFLLTIEPAR